MIRRTPIFSGGASCYGFNTNGEWTAAARIAPRPQRPYLPLMKGQIEGRRAHFTEEPVRRASGLLAHGSAIDQSQPELLHMQFHSHFSLSLTVIRDIRIGSAGG